MSKQLEGKIALVTGGSRGIGAAIARIINAVVPASVKRTLTAKMFRKTLASKTVPQSS
jgi:NADP-dependent 3-hydroxy acid dehydrogenase YdfG